MKGAFLALFLILPSHACAEVPSRQEFSFLSSFMQMIAALSIVIGLILLARHFSGKMIGGTAVPRFGSRYIRLVETRHIAPKKTLVLVEVGGEYLLLANSDAGLTLVKQVNILEEIEVIEDAGGSRSGLSGLFRGFAGKWRS